ncbi:peptidoglycan-binding protein [Hydrogenophaga crassostreae]|uniref:Peptidoglycan-binding protein n=1 Tax=Hydrogenophaga crassostreae TaxID=1763535 RepID=A0A1D8P3K0_9BURK|nr:peptidoglycan-binding protein [Hydrogenophaga crassostreae]
MSSTRSSISLRSLTGGALLLGLLASSSVWAQTYPITEGQRARASAVAQAGVPLSELAANAPSSYKVVRGDTLWRISGLFLKSPWRWPELWGMNLEEIKNPHRIYPGQELFLDISNGRARLTTSRPGGIETIRVSPRTRSESVSESAIPPVDMQQIEAFLAEPLIVDEKTYVRAPRIVATPENRVLLSVGDRAYARSTYGSSVDGLIEPLSTAPGKPRKYRVFRDATALKDPSTGEVLAYEAQYIGKANIVRSEEMRQIEKAPEPAETMKAPAREDVYKAQFDNTSSNVERVQVKEAAPSKASEAPGQELIPASLDITAAKEEIRVGDRLLPEPPREFSNYVPAAAPADMSGQIVSVYGDAVHYAAQNQVVSINRGASQGITNGQVFALLRDSNTIVDKTDESRPTIRLPGERNGLMMVFRTFDRVSYAVVLQISDGVKVGDRFVSP